MDATRRCSGSRPPASEKRTRPLPRTARLRALGAVVGTAFRADARGAVAQVLLAAVNSSSIAQVVGLKLLVDAAETSDLGRAMTGALLIAGLGFAGRLANNIGFRVLATLQDKTDLLIDQRIMRLTMGIPGIEHYERPDYADELELLRTQREALSQVLTAITAGLVLLFRAGITFALLLTLHPSLVLLPLFSIPSVILGGRAERYVLDAEQRVGTPTRRAAHLFRVATTAAPGKELRIFGLQQEIRGRHLAEWKAIEDERRRAQLRAAGISTLGWLVFAVGFVAAITLVALRAVNGDATVGDVVLAFSLAGQLNGEVAGAVGSVTALMRALTAAGRLVWLEDQAAGAEAAMPGRDPAPPTIADGIELDAVSFQYPGTDAPVLVDVSVRLPGGSVVAIVGDNGAGKSTLVKLLLRMYEPSSGVIRVDGTPLATFDPVEWRRRCASGFQDFARFEFRARETVGVGDLDRIQDEQHVAGALDRAAGADVLANLGQGLDTQLGRTFSDGTELSGGQWQKLALGRAMMREAPLLLVLDEPTAALDAEAEHTLFERYARLARGTAGNGAITVLVSHRFSTARMADLILVISDGRLVEFGSHGELVRQAGLYAELYELQARAYR